jgi:septum site-determining protein MinC
MTAIRRPREGDADIGSIHIRGALYPLMMLRVVDPRDQTFFTALMKRIAQAPDFFKHAPLVLDLQDLAAAPPFNMAELVRRLRQHQLVPIGVVNGTSEQNRSAVNTGLSIMPEAREAPRQPPAERPRPDPAAEKPVAEEKAPELPAPAAPPAAPSLLLTQPVRSGQQIYAEGGDLVVVAATSAGAELLADGHIHVYGPLRGRAHAGARGDRRARIFCHNLEAELVSVAGHWLVRDDMPDSLIGNAVQIFLDDGRVLIEPLI